VFDHLHLLLVVVVASSGREVVEPVDLLGLSWMAAAALFSSTRETRLVPVSRRCRPPSQDPCQGNWPGWHHLGGDRLDLVNGTQIALEVLANKTGAGLTRIVVAKSSVERISPVRNPRPSGE